MAKGTVRNPVNVVKGAIKSMSLKDEGKKYLNRITFYECGDAMATDSFRMFVAHDVYEGDAINMPYEVAKEISKCKASANPTATIEVIDGMFKATMADGRVITGTSYEKDFPSVRNVIDHKRLLKMSEPRIYPEVETKLVEAVLKEHAKMKRSVMLEMESGTLHVYGIGEESHPEYTLEGTHCEGYEFVGVDPAYLLDAMRSIGKVARIGIGDHTKPIRVTNDDESAEVIVMPVRTEKPKKEQPMKNTESKPAAKPTTNHKIETLAGEHVCITGTLQSMTRTRAFARLAAVGGNKSERFTSKTTVLVIADKAGKAKREAAERAIAKGQKLTVISGDEFEAILTKMEAESRTKAKRTKVEKPIEVKPVEQPKPEPKPEPVAETATVVTLEYMKSWANDKPKVRVDAAGKGERQMQNPIWVCGDVSPYKAELKTMGFVKGTSKKFGRGYYRNPDLA